jgi:hypothetical protein
VPTPAQDRVRRGPLAALLILLGLVLASGTAAAAGFDLSTASRLGPSRPGQATALLPPATRNPLDEEESDPATGPSPLPSAPGVVTERLGARPRPETPSPVQAAVPHPPGASYRARAPPAA